MKFTMELTNFDPVTNQCDCPLLPGYLPYDEDPDRMDVNIGSLNLGFCPLNMQITLTLAFTLANCYISSIGFASGPRFDSKHPD